MKKIIPFLMPLGIFLLVVLTMTGCTGGSVNSNTTRTRQNGDHLIVDDAKDPQLYKNLLVVAANSDEIISFRMKIVRYRYEQISSRPVMVFRSKIDDKKVYLILQEDIDRVPHQQYGIIHLKGHTKHMNGMIDMLKDRPYLIKNKETILLIGGCETTQMIGLVSSLQVIPITITNVAQSAHNDYLDLQLHSILHRMSVAEALTEIRRNASVTMD